MGNQEVTPEEELLSEEERKLNLSILSPADVFSVFAPFLAENSMHEDNFFKFAKDQRINLDNTSIVPHQQDFYFALRASTHHYKPRLCLVAFTLLSSAIDDVKAETLFATYCQEGLCPIEMIKVLIYNMIDVSLNVSKKLIPENAQLVEHLNELRRARKLMHRSVSLAIGKTQITKEQFRQVMVRDEFKSLLTTSGLRQRLRKLLQENKKPRQPLPISKDMEAKYPLMRPWVIYEMWEQNKKDASNYDKRMAEVSTFSDLHSFWQLWGHLPHASPSTLFSVYESDGSIRKRVVVDINQTIEAISVFQQGVTPRWEDPANASGCDIKTKQTCSDLTMIDQMWNNLVFAVIGETLPYSSEITGCRVVDKSKRNYNFELWLRFNEQSSPSELNELKDALKNLFPERSVLNVTNHMTTK